MNFPYGAVYKVYREDTPETIRANLDAMRACGMNLVVVWPAVYWWEDPDQPDYPYATGKEILRHAERIGLSVVMETAGQIPCLEYAPDFLMKDEYLAVTAEGLPSRDNGHYYYGYLNYFHPGVRDLLERHLTGIATAYRGFPALYGYDVWNETMFESHDPHTERAFQEWLQAKYGTLRALNDSWDRTFSDWRQARFSRQLWASVMPFVDYKQFHKDAIGRILREWAGFVRSADPGHPVLADNIHSMVTDDRNYGERAQDDWVVADAVDGMGISFYPKGGLQAMPAFRRSLTFAAVRAANRGRGFWLSELQTHHQALFNPFSAVEPHELRRWCLEALAQGARAVVYWKWNLFRKGLQTGGRGLLDSAGEPTVRHAEAARIARMLQADPGVGAAEPLPARAAILYDRLCHDFTKAYTLAYAPAIPDTIYTDGIEGLYRSLWDRNVAADVVTPQDVLEGRVGGFRALFATGQLITTPALDAALQSYVRAGGLLVVDAKFGEVDDRGLLHPRIPGGWTDLLGFRALDMHPTGLEIRMDWDGWQDGFSGYYERKSVAVSSPASRVVGRFADGSPAVFLATLGRGQVLYFATFLWAGATRRDGGNPAVGPLDGAARVAAFLDRTYGLAQVATDDPDLKVALKRNGEDLYLFAWNDADREVECAVHLKDDGPAYAWRPVEPDVHAAPVAAPGGRSARVRVPARESAVFRLEAP